MKKFGEILRKADELRSDPNMKTLFESLLVAFVDGTDDGATKRVIRLSYRMLLSSIKIDDLAGARMAIHGGAPLHRTHDITCSSFFEAASGKQLNILWAMLAPKRGDSGKEPVYATPMVLAAFLGLRHLGEAAPLTITTYEHARDYIGLHDSQCLSSTQLDAIVRLETSPYAIIPHVSALLSCMVAPTPWELVELYTSRTQLAITSYHRSGGTKEFRREYVLEYPPNVALAPRFRNLRDHTNVRRQSRILKVEQLLHRGGPIIDNINRLDLHGHTVLTLVQRASRPENWPLENWPLENWPLPTDPILDSQLSWTEGSSVPDLTSKDVMRGHFDRVIALLKAKGAKTTAELIIEQMEAKKATPTQPQPDQLRAPSSTITFMPSRPGAETTRNEP